MHNESKRTILTENTPALRLDRLDAADDGRAIALGTCSHMLGRAARARALLPLEVVPDNFCDVEAAERSNWGGRIGGSPAVVRLRGRAAMVSLAMLGLLSATTGDETFETSTPNGRLFTLGSEWIRTVRFGTTRRVTAGEISIRSSICDCGARPKEKGSTLRPV